MLPPWNHRQGLFPSLGRARVKMYLPAVADTPAMISESIPCHIVLPNRVSEPSHSAPPICAKVRPLHLPADAYGEAGYDPKKCNVGFNEESGQFEIEIKGSNSFYDDNLSALMEMIQKGEISRIRIRPLYFVAQRAVTLGARLTTARTNATYYRTVLVPLRQQIVNDTQLEYNAMQIGLYELLAAKQAQVDALADKGQSLRIDQHDADAGTIGQGGIIGHFAAIPGLAGNNSANVNLFGHKLPAMPIVGQLRLD